MMASEMMDRFDEKDDENNRTCILTNDANTNAAGYRNIPRDRGKRKFVPATADNVHRNIPEELPPVTSPWSLSTLPMPHPLVLTLFTIMTAHLVTFSLASKLLIEVPLMVATFKLGKVYLDYFKDVNDLMAKRFPNIKRKETKSYDKMPWQRVVPLFAAELFDFFKAQLHTRAFLYSGVLTSTPVVGLFVCVSILQSLALLNGVVKRFQLRVNKAESIA